MNGKQWEWYIVVNARNPCQQHSLLVWTFSTQICNTVTNINKDENATDEKCFKRKWTDWCLKKMGTQAKGKTTANIYWELLYIYIDESLVNLWPQSKVLSAIIHFVKNLTVITVNPRCTCEKSIKFPSNNICDKTIYPWDSRVASPLPWTSQCFFSAIAVLNGAKHSLHVWDLASLWTSICCFK